jgi:hypothetical protein
MLEVKVLQVRWRTWAIRWSWMTPDCASDEYLAHIWYDLEFIGLCAAVLTSLGSLAPIAFSREPDSRKGTKHDS